MHIKSFITFIGLGYFIGQILNDLWSMVSDCGELIFFPKFLLL